MAGRVELLIACRDADRPAARAMLDTVCGAGFGASSLHLEVERGAETWWVAHGVVSAAQAQTIEANAARVGSGLVVRTTRDERDGKVADDPDPRTSLTRTGVTVKEREVAEAPKTRVRS